MIKFKNAGTTGPEHSTLTVAKSVAQRNERALDGTPKIVWLDIGANRDITLSEAQVRKLVDELQGLLPPTRTDLFSGSL